jgi:hypothetical protein
MASLALYLAKRRPIAFPTEDVSTCPPAVTASTPVAGCSCAGREASYSKVSSLTS